MSVNKSFFLYDQLLDQNKSSISKLTNTELTELMTNIKSLDKTGQELVFVLVRTHSLKNNDCKIFDIPYSGEKTQVENDSEQEDGSFDVKFDAKNFPIILQRILLTFSKMRINEQKINEQKRLAEQQVQN
jgi:hypothetical protein